MKNKRIPLRTCVVTKEQFPKQELIRIVRDKEGNVPYDIHILFEEASPDIIEKATIRNNNIARRYFIRKASKLKKYYI